MKKCFKRIISIRTAFYLVSSLTLIFSNPLNADTENMQHFDMTTPRSIIIFGDLFIVDHWFFIGKKDGQYQASLHTTENRNVVVGQVFGFRVNFVTTKEKVKLKVVLHLPSAAAERFPSHTGQVTITPDDRTVIVDDEISGAKESIAYYWGIGSGDPLGQYSLSFSLDDVPVGNYIFEVK